MYASLIGLHTCQLPHSGPRYMPYLWTTTAGATTTMNITTTLIYSISRLLHVGLYPTEVNSELLKQNILITWLTKWHMVVTSEVLGTGIVTYKPISDVGCQTNCSEGEQESSLLLSF